MALSKDIVNHWYVTHGPMVYRRCRALLKSDEAAAEAMQDVFVEVVRRCATLSDDAPLSLLYRMATNVSLNCLRRGRSRPEDLTDDDRLLERIACAPNTEPALVASQFLQKLFGQSEDLTRVMAVLHLLDGMTLEQVARETGFSVSGVRKRLETLKRHVKELDTL